jgi:phage terminase small subunit
MAVDLNTLIEQGRQAPVREYAGDENNIRKLPKPIGQEPGEPELIEEPPPEVMNGLRRRIMQRQLASDRRVRFARALVEHSWNVDKAMFSAGYNPKSKHRSGAIQTLMNHPDVIHEIRRIRNVLDSKADVATIDLTKEWIAIASSNVFDAFIEVPGEDGETHSLHLKSKADIPASVQRTVKSVKIKRWRQIQKDGSAIETENIEVALWDKQAALDSLAKIQGLYADKTADAIDGLAMKIAQRTEKYRKKIGVTYEQDPIAGTG